MECVKRKIQMGIWNALSNELRLMIFKGKCLHHLIERKNKLNELLKERHVKIIDPEDETKVYDFYIENKRCSSRQFN
jgi:hypothetical protein